jgi:hypothetical protein
MEDETVSDGSNVFVGKADRPIVGAEIRMAGFADAMRSKIVRWHVARRTFDDLQASQALFFFALIHHAQADPHAAGLVVRGIHPNDLQSSVGRSRGGFYRCIEALERAGMVRRFKEPQFNFATYELLVPPPPPDVENDSDGDQTMCAGATASAPLVRAEHKWRAGADLASAPLVRASLTGEDGEPPSAPLMRASAPLVRAEHLGRAGERHDMSDVIYDHDHGAGGVGEGGEENSAELLASLTFGNGEKLGAGGIRRMLSSSTCTPDRIRLAYRIANEKGANPPAYFFRLVMQPELRDDQIDVEAAQHRRADAGERAQAKKDQAKHIQSQPSAFVRTALSKAPSPPPESVMREGLAKCLAALGKTPKQDPPSPTPAIPAEDTAEATVPQTAEQLAEIEALRLVMLRKQAEAHIPSPSPVTAKG